MHHISYSLVIVFCSLGVTHGAIASTLTPTTGTAIHKTYKALPDSVPLTKAQVRHWLKLRIASARLQKKMQANADQYDDLIHTYFKKRDALLKKKGLPVKEYKYIENRIYAALSAMDSADDLAKEKSPDENYTKAVANIRANDRLSQKQKAKFLKQEKAALKTERYLRKHTLDGIAVTKPDWPAVKAYRKKIKKFGDWYDGNIPKPPEIK